MIDIGSTISFNTIKIYLYKYTYITYFTSCKRNMQKMQRIQKQKNLKFNWNQTLKVTHWFVLGKILVFNTHINNIINVSATCIMYLFAVNVFYWIFFFFFCKRKEIFLVDNAYFFLFFSLYNVDICIREY